MKKGGKKCWQRELTNEPSGGTTSNKCRKANFKSQLEQQTKQEPVGDNFENKTSVTTTT